MTHGYLYRQYDLKGLWVLKSRLYTDEYDCNVENLLNIYNAK